MATVNLGRVTIVPKGNWASGVTYRHLDVVRYQSAFYMCLVQTTAVPTDTSKWMLLVQDGISGEVTSEATVAVNGELALFSDTTGKRIKRATSTGVLKATNGVLGVLAEPTGAIVGTSDTQTLTGKTISFADNTLTNVASTNTTQTLTNKTISSPTISGIVDEIGSSRSAIVAIAASDVDCSAGNYFTKSVETNTTFTFSNAPSSRAYGFILEVFHSAGAIVWPTTVKWSGNIAPTLTTSRTHIFIFFTKDGGELWHGSALVNYTN